MSVLQTYKWYFKNGDKSILRDSAVLAVALILSIAFNLKCFAMWGGFVFPACVAINIATLVFLAYKTYDNASKLKALKEPKE